MWCDFVHGDAIQTCIVLRIDIDSVCCHSIYTFSAIFCWLPLTQCIQAYTLIENTHINSARHQSVSFSTLFLLPIRIVDYDCWCLNIISYQVNYYVCLLYLYRITDWQLWQKYILSKVSIKILYNFLTYTSN